MSLEVRPHVSGRQAQATDIRARSLVDEDLRTRDDRDESQLPASVGQLPQLGFVALAQIAARDDGFVQPDEARLLDGVDGRDEDRIQAVQLRPDAARPERAMDAGKVVLPRLGREPREAGQGAEVVERPLELRRAESTAHVEHPATGKELAAAEVEWVAARVVDVRPVLGVARQPALCHPARGQTVDLNRVLVQQVVDREREIARQELVADVRDRRGDVHAAEALDLPVLRERDPAEDAAQVVRSHEPLRLLERRLRARRAHEDVVGGPEAAAHGALHAHVGRLAGGGEEREARGGGEDHEEQRQGARAAVAKLHGQEARHLSVAASARRGPSRRRLRA
jgi:hypothetical protein